eukprot:7608964-Prorocentrum_lima.AAC.1
MTSSLVGSEMCIRDRENLVLQQQMQRGQDLGQVAAQLQSVRTAISSRSVSYTHLTLPTICSV